LAKTHARRGAHGVRAPALKQEVCLNEETQTFAKVQRRARSARPIFQDWCITSAGEMSARAVPLTHVQYRAGWGRTSPSSGLSFDLRRDYHFTEYLEEAGHKQTERELKFFLKFFLDRRAQAGKMLLSTLPTFNVDRSGWI
jgi:hypothetical protein